MLTRMGEEGLSFEEALKEAQEKGYAELHPEADVEGYDACRKAVSYTHLRLLVFTRRSATGSPPSSLAFNNVILAPISWHTFKIPARVSLIPTLFIMISEFGVIRAATIKKAAEEISPGTSICCPCKVSGGVMVQVFLSDTILAPKERSIRSV